ncbi:coiled-coil and C2 domain-containing protein 1-like isoform X1 [Drosophila kikkawai]|uniref:Coiled-coil and C2 domain-containing protein 1-like n=1 Tax=Drosophila kikkawai TaxID=30033 RepID=A0A6P4IUZ0_DROKI|nr:coiled-coil and C2 domain-containing protein 1-like isoform X1 [Drosophila kikkawai]
MFSKKKPEPAKRRQHDLSQFGLTEIPDDFDPSAGYGDDDGGDSDLEAELAAIASGGGGRPKPKPKAKLVPASDLDKMIADSLRDVSDDDDDENLENDSDLLGELNGIGGVDMEEDEEQPAEEPAAASEEPVQTFLPTTTVDTLSIIKQRLEMYKVAEANAKAAGDSGKARRFARGLKTLQDLHKQAAAGKSINVDDIPPEVSVKPAGGTAPAVAAEESPAPSTPASPPPIPSRAAPAPPTPTSPIAPTTSVAPSTPPNPLVAQMRSRQNEYKAAALQSKRSGDTATALQFLKVVKQFDVVVKMCEDGQEVDLSDMPPPPAEFLAFLAKMNEGAASKAAAEPSPAPSPVVPAAAPAPAAATNILEALQQRLEKYQSVEAAAKAENNTGKARRFGRIVKQYEDAIKLYKAGKPVPYDELPVPPGFGPLPTGDAAPAPAPSLPTSPASPPATASTSAGGTPSSSSAATPTTPRKAPSPPKELTTRTSGNQQKNNLAEQQMKLLLERQKEFKVAAIEANKAGEIDQAKEYLKIYKGFDSLLNAASSGLPVDLSTLPVPPSQRDNLEASFAIVSAEECDPSDDICEIGIRMEEQLAKQLMMCKNTRDHHKAMGDVAGMNRFENLALTVQKDLDLVRYSKRKNQTLPKFHYEQRSFNIVHCNTDLTDNELEIVVVRGVNYNVANPKEVDTYVRVEFPLLNDESFKTKTNVIRDTNSPDYDERFKVDIQRTNRQFQRIFKRHGVKLEIYSRGCSVDCCGLSRKLPLCCFRGFLRSDTLIGTVNVKLQPLETKCDIHDTYDLMDGRKQVGGKLEVKVRVRNPILTKQMEHINEKWLVLDA